MAFKIRVLGVFAMETFYYHKLIQYNNNNNYNNSHSNSGEWFEPRWYQLFV